VPDISLLIIGLIAGGIAAWFIASSRAGKRHEERLRSLQGSASASEALVEELRSQVQQRDAEINTVRESLDSARQEKAETQARLEESQKSLGEQREAIEKMDAKINETFKSLSLEALSKNTTEFLKLADKTLKSQAEMGSKELEGKKKLIDQNLESMSRKLYEMQKKFEEIGQGNIVDRPALGHDRASQANPGKRKEKGRMGRANGRGHHKACRDGGGRELHQAEDTRPCVREAGLYVFPSQQPESEHGREVPDG
jgi:hypothetical protein